MLSYSNIPHEFGDPNHSAHAGIDARIVALGIAHDDLVLARLKKQRLHIRDEIAVMLGSAFASDGAHG